MDRFRDKVVLITGASSGIGKASALKYASEGAKVVVADVSQDEGQQAVEEINKAGRGESFFVACNVADVDSVKQMVRQTIDKFGRIDVAVNNAGIGGASAHTADYPEDEWHNVININLTGVYLCMKYQLQEMAKAKRSIAADIGEAGNHGGSQVDDAHL